MGAIGPRMTRQKQLVLDIVQGTTSHPTADWVYQEARRQIPDISLGTVYRNLNTLAQQGIIREMTYAGASSRYDGNVEAHYHFVCEDCKRVFDIFIDRAENLDEKAEEMSGHEIQGHRLEFYGRCAECRKATVS
ncbi:transcriptional repressor [Heliobacillus mobilis]|uniref:Transcriptional repressor n=1 Tax=Heliobacterium mobile TaxID=28064 RepID=A0A6I3SD83_HELMO|nr:transcriptional repressor [Heliobacterium mobile]MTV47545.1 transcriptional repressor [Heliobacterium mobile]